MRPPRPRANAFVPALPESVARGSKLSHCVESSLPRKLVNRTAVANATPIGSAI